MSENVTERTKLEKLNDAVGKLAADAEEFAKSVASSANAAIARGRELHDAASAKARDTARRVDDTVRDRPWESVAVAAVAGLLVGLLIGRK